MDGLESEMFHLVGAYMANWILGAILLLETF